MKNIENTNLYSVRLYDKNDYVEDFDQINFELTKILMTHENGNFGIEESQAELQRLTDDIFYCEDVDTKIYVLYHNLDERPISFALLTHDETRYDWHMELICTDANYCGLGYGTELFNAVAKDISKTKSKTLSSIIERENEASIAIHEGFAKKNNVENHVLWLDNDRLLYEYNLREFNKEKNNNFDNNL